MASRRLKQLLAEQDETLSSISQRVGATPKLAHMAVVRWEGKVGTPMKATRRVLKEIARVIGSEIYTEHTDAVYTYGQNTKWRLK